MEREILKHFANCGKPTNDEINALLKLSKDQQCISRNHNSKPSWPQVDLSSSQQSNNSSTTLRLPNPLEQLQMMHGQNPYIAPSQMSPPFDSANGFLSLSANNNHHSKDAHKTTFELRCFVCGAGCANIVDLNQHLKQHIPPEETQRANMEKSEENITKFHKKSWSDSSSHSSDVDGASTNFPIPIPNFALFNESMSSASNLAGKAKDALKDNVVPPLGINLPFNPSLYPAFPGALGLLNPLLNYQNLINSKGFGQSGTLPGLNIGPFGYLPYVGGIPSSPAANLVPIAGRIPYFSGLPIGVPPAVSQNTSAINSTLRPDRNQPAKTTTSDVTNGTYSHSEALNRRLSVPLVGHDSEFRVPHPYTRIRKPSHNNAGHSSALHEKVESTNEQLAHQYRNSQVSNAKRAPVEDKSTNQLNAKSIEQHISNIISNNEKLLTNPELERVKPRRVFRRNSLDPASLSSYTTGVSKYNPRDAAYYKESALKPRRMLSESDNIGGLPSTNSKSFESYDSYTSNLSLAEYNKMIQLTRAPFNVAEKHNAASVKLGERVSNVPGSSDSDHIRGRDLMQAKRDFPLTYSQQPKKSRRSSFFECNDCGVRYRKEENYKIHKEVYCKFKNVSSHDAKEKLRRHSDLSGVSPETHRPRFSTDSADTSRLPHFKLSRPPTSHVSFSSANGDLVYSSVKNTRPDLCRTKSAEASLESSSVRDNKWKKSFESPYTTLSPVAQRTTSSCASVLEALPTNSSCCDPASPSFQPEPGVNNSIPPSKLPPNKRHLMRHLEQSSPPSISAHDDATHSSMSPNDTSSGTSEKIHGSISEAQGENEVDDTLIPRSNYKLLVHQISLRNMQDIDLMSDLSTNLLHNKSVWSWEQIQGLKHNQLQQDYREACTDSPSQGMPPSLRKFSVPSRYLPPVEATSDSFLCNSQNSFTSGTSTSSTESEKQNISSDSRHNSAPTPCSKISVNDINNKASDCSAPEQSKDESTSTLSPLDPKNRSSDQQLPTISESPGTACQENARSVENQTKSEGNKLVVLYPHTEPVLDSGTCVSFCCMVSPQPACIETCKSNEKKNAQMSMYSEWAVLEPFLVPKDLSIGDILNGWCQCRAACQRGVVTCMSHKSDLLLTDNKAYEKLNEKNKTTTEDKRDADTADNKNPQVPTLEPYQVVELAGLLSNSVFTSCNYKRTNNSFPFHSISPFTEPSTTDLLPSSCSSGVVEVDNDVTFEKRIGSPLSGVTDASSEEESVTRESDSAEELMNLSGRVKRRRSRKHRSSTSPREKRKAAGGSPVSILPVHPDGACSTSDEKQPDCALCSMKAGKGGSSRAESSGSKSPAPVLSSAIKFNPSSSLTTPAVTGAVLDRTRGISGNTQHWVSDVSRHDPSPTSSSSEACADTPCPPLSHGEGGGISVDVGDRNSAVVSSSLAEVVSEVMRSAAMQSKMNKKRRQLLSGSRALLPADEEDDGPVSKRRNIHGILGTRNDDSNDLVPTVLRNSTPSPISEAVSSCVVPSSESRTNGLSGRNTSEDDSTSNQIVTSSAEGSVQQINGQSAADESQVGDPLYSAQHGFSSSGHEDEDSDGRYESTKNDSPPSSPGVARPFRCSECKIAFRIGGHLAKHLRSKGHTLAVQKKTLNRLKMSQIQRLTTGVNAESETSHNDDKQMPNEQPTPVLARSSGSTSDAEVSEILTGSGDVLGRAQVRALLQGNDEYACVPLAEQARQCEISDEGGASQQDPRPYKCIACRVAFRFQGHLDRHFRSNSHLIAIGHYEHNPFGIVNMSINEQNRFYGNDLEKKSSHDSDTATSREAFYHIPKAEDGSSGKEENRLVVPNGICSFSPIHEQTNQSHDSPHNPSLEAASQMNGSSENRTNFAHKHMTPPLPCQVSCT